MDTTADIDLDDDEEPTMEAAPAAEDAQAKILEKLDTLQRRRPDPEKRILGWIAIALAVGGTIVGVAREFSLKADLVDLAHMHDEMDTRVRSVELKQATEDEMLRGIESELAHQRGKLDDILAAVQKARP